MKRQLVGISEVAELLGVSISTLYSWVNQRRIPYFKIGRLVKFDVNEIDKWVAEKRVDTYKF